MICLTYLVMMRTYVSLKFWKQQVQGCDDSRMYDLRDFLFGETATFFLLAFPPTLAILEEAGATETVSVRNSSSEGSF